MTDVNAVAEPSAATIQAPQEIDLSKLTSEERSTWRTTGNLPKTEEAESSDAPKEAESEPEGKSEAESEPAPKQEPKGKPSHKLTAEQRIAQLTAKLKEAEKKLTERDTKPEPKVETKPEVKPEPKKEAEAPKAPTRPKIKDYDGSEGKTLDDYDAAMEKYESDRDQYFADLAAYNRELTKKEVEQEQSHKDALGKIQNEWNEAKKRYGDEFETIAAPVIQGLADKAISPTVVQVLRQAKNVTDVLYTIGGDEAERDAFLADAKTNPVEAIRKLAVYEYLVAETLKGEKKEPPKKAPEKPVTSAPPPVREVGGSGSSTDDPGLAAARANDVRGAFREWNRQASEGRIR